MEKGTLIRKIYLYLFSVVGLTLLVIGCVRFLDMGLKAFIFKEAEKQYKLDWEMPYAPSCEIQKVGPQIMAGVGKEITVKLSAEQSAGLSQQLQDYQNWKKNREGLDVIKAKRHRDASINLSLIIVGLPLYLFHWLTIKKETNNQPKQQAELV